MLSRLVSSGARAVAPRSLRAMPTLQRHFSTPAVASSDNSPQDAITKYGSTAFWGALAAILVSKEVYIINAETLLAAEIIAFVGTAYVLTGDTIDKMSREQDQKKTDQFADANDFMLEMFNQYKTTEASAQNTPAVLEEYLKEYKEAVVQHAAHETVVPQHAARASVLATLEGIKNREQHAAAMEWQEHIDRAMANVNKNFRSDQKVQMATLDLAISNLGQDPSPDQKDPVKDLILNEFPDEE